MEMDENNNRWLLRHAESVTSQCGEDGILRKVLEVIGKTDGWCVEFGAWDGRHMSNTYDLIQNRGYHGVLIEASSSRMGDLRRTYDGNQRVIPVNAFVGFDSSTLDEILAKTPIPKDFDLLSIDIDGNDYHVWDATREYRPKVVIIEHNPTIPSEVDFVQPRDSRVSQGNSARALERLGKSKGYELVCATRLNCIFVDAKFFPKFNIADNSLVSLREDTSSVTYIFTLYDGTVKLAGHRRLPWNGIPFRSRKVQQVPFWLRVFSGNHGALRRRLAEWHRKWVNSSIAED